MFKRLLLTLALLLPAAFATSAQAQVAQCRATTSAPTYTTATNDPLSCQTDGDLRVTVPDGVVLNSGSLTSTGYSCSVTFTPAASSHTAGDANGAAGTCATIGPSGKEIIITSATLEIDGGTVEATAWRLYLYSVTPPSATADDAAWDLPSGDRASYLGYVDLGTAVDLGSTQWVQNHILNQQVKLAGTSLFGYLVNLSTVSTAAVAHIVTLHTVAP